MLFTDMFAQTGKDIGEILHDLGEEEVEKRWNEENRIRQERTIDMGKLIEIADAAVEEKNAAMQRAEEYLDSITDQKSVKKCIMNMLEYTFTLGMKGKKSNYFDEDREANYREIEKMILSNPYGSEKSQKAIGEAAREVERICVYLTNPRKFEETGYEAGYQLGMGSDFRFVVWACVHAFLIPGLITDYEQIKAMMDVQISMEARRWNKNLDKMKDVSKATKELFVMETVIEGQRYTAPILEQADEFERVLEKIAEDGKFGLFKIE